MRIKNQILLSVNRYYVLYAVVFIYLTWPSRFAMIYYENYDGEEIERNLVRKGIRNSTNQEIIHCVSFHLKS
jgi:hypothetical protein